MGPSLLYISYISFFLTKHETILDGTWWQLLYKIYIHWYLLCLMFMSHLVHNSLVIPILAGLQCCVSITQNQKCHYIILFDLSDELSVGSGPRLRHWHLIPSSYQPIIASPVLYQFDTSKIMAGVSCITVSINLVHQNMTGICKTLTFSTFHQFVSVLSRGHYSNQNTTVVSHYFFPFPWQQLELKCYANLFLCWN